MTIDDLAQQGINGLVNGLLVALVALGYTMVYGIIELINFAHGDVMMLAAFFTLTVIGLSGMTAGPDGGSPWLMLTLLLLLVPAFGAAANWAVDRYAYRPLRHAPKLTSLVSAIGVSFILVNLGLFWGGLPLDVFAGAPEADKDVPDLIGYHLILGIGRVQITAKDILVIATTIPLMLGLTWFVRRTRLGTAMRACAQDPVAARLMGIDVDRVISLAFVIGGALAGVAAVVFALCNNTIGFQMGYRQGMDAFTAAVLGGIGNLPGAVLGGLAIGLARAFSDQWLGTAWSNAVVFGVLILVLVFRPQGLLGMRVREKV